MSGKVSMSLDRFLVHYNKFISSSSNQDKGLKVLQWTLWLLSRIYKKPGLLKSSVDISFARYLLRFYGFPSTLEAVRHKSWEDPKTAGGAITGKLMAWAMMGYYPLEHIAYIKWTSPSLMPSDSRSFNANQYSAFSCRFWLVYLVAEMTQSILRLRRLYKEQQQKQLTNSSDDAKESSSVFDQELVGLQNSIRNEQLQLARSALFTLPCVNWALPEWDTKPWLTENVCHGLMWLESLVSMYQAIRNYQLANNE